MMHYSTEMTYATVVIVHDINRQHRDEMMRQAEQARLIKAATADRDTLGRTVLSWAGRRMVASGNYLLRRAEPAAGEITLALE